MRALVYAHRLELGGTQTNAIELSATLAAAGHDMVVAAVPGPAAELLEGTGLPYVEMPPVRQHPSVRSVRALRRVIRQHEPDLVHVWDWPQCLDAYFGVHLTTGQPLVHTVMSMALPRFLPSTLLTTFGTPDLVTDARRRFGIEASLLEPPVDTERNAPGAVEVDEFRERQGLGTGDGRDATVELVVVSRLERWLKLEGLRRTIAAVDVLARDEPVRLTIVGEGSAEEVVADAAEAVNRAHGRRVVHLTGGMIDPRPAYEHADIVLGMGSSALRAMAFGKPLIVLGERGFSEVADEDHVPTFVRQGWYGLGDGELSPDILIGQIRSLLHDSDRRRELGRLGRALVCSRYALDVTGAALEELYLAALAHQVPRRRQALAATRTAVLRVGDQTVPPALRQRVRSLVGAP